MISVDTYAWGLACTRTVDVEDVVVQASYLFRQKLVLECEKRSVGRMLDLDSFLLFLVDFWHDEQHRVEERMRSLFVGADANADGNLDFEKFVTMVKKIKANQPRREMLKMFAEHTLNRSLDPKSFLRLCHKFKFVQFDLGPVGSRKQDTNTREVFNVLCQEWRKTENVVNELLIILSDTCTGGSCVSRSRSTTTTQTQTQTQTQT